MIVTLQPYSNSDIKFHSLNLYCKVGTYKVNMNIFSIRNVRSSEVSCSHATFLNPNLVEQALRLDDNDV